MIIKKMSVLLMIVVILFSQIAFYEKSHAATGRYANNVEVSVVDFPVTLNDIHIDNKYAIYPLLLYKNITYFPMTYEYSRLLGLDTIWNQNKNMLFIGISDVPKGKFIGDAQSIRNGKKYYAKIANYKIVVNTESNMEYITDNQNDTYPIINFRNITYFPLTWKYAVNEFGWEYKYDNREGLKINSNTDIANLIFPISASHAFDTSAISGSNQKQQIHSSKWGVMFPIDVYYNDNQKLYVKNINGTSTCFDLKETLPQNTEFFIGKTGKIKPSIDGDVFKVAVEINDFKNKNKHIKMLNINLNNGSIIST